MAAPRPGNPGPGICWIVDGNNVMGSRPDGWWRDRPAAAARLVGQLARLAGTGVPTGANLVVVFDGPAPRSPASPTVLEVDLRYSGPAATADDAIVDLVAANPGGSITVFTSDAGLSRRVRALGADVTGAGALLRMIGATAPLD